MPTPQASNPYFRLVVIVGAVFAVTVMSLLAASFGHPEAPVNRFLNRYGLVLILVETVAFTGVAWRALAVDRRQTLALQRAVAEQATAAAPTAPPDAGAAE